MNVKTSIALFIAAALTVSAGALASPGHPPESETSFGRPGDAKNVTRTVTLEATEIAFNETALTFKVGETVRFVLVNHGEQNHELTIGDASTQMEHRKMMEEMASMGMTDHHMMGGEAAASHPHVMEGNNVDTVPGETKELIWQFTKPGTFEFACNYPGHAEVGMAGTITVQ